MRKAFAVAVAVGLLVGSLAMPAEAGKKKKKKAPPAPVKVERTVEANYISPATAVGLCTQTDGVGCMEIATGPEESYLTANVVDSHGQPVLISIQADTDGDNISDTTYGTFCGETKEPIKFDPGVSLIFWVSPGNASGMQARVEQGCLPGQGFQGDLSITFSNLP